MESNEQLMLTIFKFEFSSLLENINLHKKNNNNNKWSVPNNDNILNHQKKKKKNENSFLFN